MDINGAEALVHILTDMGSDLLSSVKAHEALGLQKHASLLSQLLNFETLLNNFYEISCPKSEDYINRRDLIRIYNEIAKEIYGKNDKCPVVEDFGSFVMDIFSAGSDLDLSINFSDKLFEADRVTKTKTLRKFANKFHNLRKKGHVTNVELILSARVPVLKVTDKGTGVECDFSVGNRDGIAKSHIVLMISAIDERFKKLSFLFKAWAKAQNINSSKDGTLNSISLILLVAFHLQTRDIPILPPLSAIFQAGMDPFAANRIPSYLNYGQKNQESIAELFVSLLVKLESVRDFWSKGLCASTYEGSWVYKDWKATGCIRIEDFSDRSENTARAVRSKKFNKIYSCISCSLRLIQSFNEGKLDSDKLKNLLFVPLPSKGKKVGNIVNNLKLRPVSLNSARKKGKSSVQVDPKEGQLPKLSEVGSPNSTPKKKKRKGQVGLEEGQRPGKQVKLVPSSSKAPTPSKTDEVKKKKKKKSGFGMNTFPQTSNTLTSFPVMNTPPNTLFTNPLIQVLSGVTPVVTINNANPTFQVGQAQSYSNRSAHIFAESGPQRVVGNTNDVPSSFPVRQYSLSNQPVHQYGRNRPQNSGSFSMDQRLHHFNQAHLQSYAPNFQAGPPYSFSNTSSFQRSDPYTPSPTSVTHSYQANLHTLSHGNRSELNSPSFLRSDPYSWRDTRVMLPYHQPNLHTISHRNSTEFDYPYQPRNHDVYQRNPAELQMPYNPRQSFPHVRSQFSGNIYPYQS